MEVPMISLCIGIAFFVGCAVGAILRGDEKNASDLRCRIFGHSGEAIEYEAGGYCDRCGSIWWNLDEEEKT